MAYNFKTTPFKHQLDALAQSATKKNFAYFMEMGCFDEDTEFLTQRGWRRFGDFDLETWERPLLVMQAIPSDDEPAKWSFQYVEPEAYIHKTSTEWSTLTLRSSLANHKGSRHLMCTSDHLFPMNYRWFTVNGVNGGGISSVNSVYMPAASAHYMHQCLNLDPDRKPYLNATRRRLCMELTSACTGRYLPCASKYFIPDDEVNSLNEWEIRFMVAVAADGTYPNTSNNKVDFYFRKERKVERLRAIAARAGIPLAYERIERRYGAIHVIHAIAPMRCKIYDAAWYTLPEDKLRVIASEMFFWDGTAMEDEGRFYSVHKESIDFMQFALTMSGWSTTIRYDARKAIWVLIARYRNCPDDALLPRDFKRGMHLPHRAQENCALVVDSKETHEERDAYCFRVPSGYIVIRRENQIIVAHNSGKTKVMLDNIGMLQKGGHITGALILAPKGVYRNWSEKEIPTHFPDDVDKEVLVWDASASDTRKRKLLQQVYDWDRRKFQFMVFNIESLISERGKILLQAFVRTHGGNVLALVDESTCIKNHRAKRTKEAIEIAKRCKARRIATGSPVTNSPLDLYSQCAFLDPGLLGCGSYYAFKNTYANIEKVQNRQGQHYEKILSYKNLDRLSALLDKFSFRVTKKECLDLPDKIYTTRDVDLTPEQVKLYREMANYQYTILKDGDDIKEMSAQVVLTKLLRLHQILCGTFTSDDGEVKRLPNNRLDALQEVLDETSGKVIIWATYLGDIEAIQEMLTNEYGAGSFVSYYGATSSEDRTKAIELFQDEKSNVRFFVGNVQTAGRGITLTAASTVVYYSNNFSLELRQQSEDRAHRLGQKNNVTYVDLVVRGSLDEKIIKSLLEKRNIANEILKDDLEPWISLRHA